MTDSHLMSRFDTVSPLDSRYYTDNQEFFARLHPYVSEAANIRYLLKVEVALIKTLAKWGICDAEVVNEVEEACKRAQIHDVILTFRSADPNAPRGYDTIITDSFPSGGQKRLIALARCLIRQPEVLLLDEPTESLGAQDINRLVTVIRDYAQGENPRTCFVISHQLNFIASVADRIIVLNEGKVVDTGTHDELLAREGLYKTLYELKNVDPALLRTRPSEPEGGPAMMAGAMPA